jgi:hypothetical protein
MIKPLMWSRVIVFNSLEGVDTTIVPILWIGKKMALGIPFLSLFQFDGLGNQYVVKLFRDLIRLRQS